MSFKRASADQAERHSKGISVDHHLTLFTDVLLV
jgi:hypothetical protein